MSALFDGVGASGQDCARQRLDRPGTGEEIDAAWDEEIRARVKAVDESRVAGTYYEQIKKEMAARFSSIALDLLLAEEGYHRASGNPLLWLPNAI